MFISPEVSCFVNFLFIFFAHISTGNALFLVDLQEYLLYSKY